MRPHRVVDHFENGVSTTRDAADVGFCGGPSSGGPFFPSRRHGTFLGLPMAAWLTTELCIVWTRCRYTLNWCIYAHDQTRRIESRDCEGLELWANNHGQ